MNSEYLNLVTCLERASQFHGDLCAGLALGTRIACLGLKAIGIEDPLGDDRKKIVVYAESDRCATDAILAVTGCHPGKRSLKVLDYGKIAATFVNLETGKAVRIAVKEKNGSREEPGARNALENGSLVERYTTIPAEDLFDVREVTVAMKPEDRPGKTVSVVRCSKCGERIMDKREVRLNGSILCIPCATGKTYWQEKQK